MACDETAQETNKEEDSIELRINSLSGFVCVINADRDSTIGCLKERVSKVSAYPVREQKLLLGSRVLKDADKVSKLFRGAQANKVSADVLLVRVPDPVVMGQIERLKAASSADMVIEALTQLGCLGEKACPAVPAMADLLEHESATVRLTAANAIGRVGPGGAHELLRALASDDVDVRREAAAGLGRLGVTAAPAVPLLVRRLGAETSAQERYAAARSLGELGTVAAPAAFALAEALADRDTLVSRSAGEALVSIGMQAMPAMQRALSDERERVREKAARSIGRLGGSSTGGASLLLAHMLDDASSSVRQAAAEALGQLGERAGEAAAPALASALEDPSEVVRLEAAKALVNLGTLAEPALPSILQALDDTSLPVALVSTQALGQLGTAAEAAIPALAEVATASTKPHQHRLKAVKALRTLKLPLCTDVRQVLQRVFANRQDVALCRETAVLLLQLSSDENEALSVLTEQIAVGCPVAVRKAALLALSSLGTAALPAVSQIAFIAEDETDEAEVRIQAITARNELSLHAYQVHGADSEHLISDISKHM